MMGGQTTDDSSATTIDKTVGNFQAGTILKGRIVGIVGDDVVVDVGLKSEGVVPASRVGRPLGDRRRRRGRRLARNGRVRQRPGGHQQAQGRPHPQLGAHHRDHQGRRHRQGQGHAQDQGRPAGGHRRAGVPAGQPGGHPPPGDIGEYIGREIEAKILKIDNERRNIVISRRKLHRGAARRRPRRQLLDEIEIGQRPQGHGQEHRRLRRVRRPGRHRRPAAHHRHELGPDQPPVARCSRIDQEIEVKVLQRRPRQGEDRPGPQAEAAPARGSTIEEKYPVGSRVKGEVVNIMTYGAFVKLEEGVEGLVHISEMSWTRRINHPSASWSASATRSRSWSWRSTRTSRKSASA